MSKNFETLVSDARGQLRQDGWSDEDILRLLPIVTGKAETPATDVNAGEAQKQEVRYLFSAHQMYRVLEGTIETFLEYRDQHGKDEGNAAHLAAQEIIEGLDAEQELIAAGESVRTPSQIILSPAGVSDHAAGVSFLPWDRKTQEHYEQLEAELGRIKVTGCAGTEYTHVKNIPAPPVGQPEAEKCNSCQESAKWKCNHGIFYCDRCKLQLEDSCGFKPIAAPVGEQDSGEKEAT